MLLCLLGGTLPAQSNFFSEPPARTLPEAVASTQYVSQFRVYRLDEPALRDYLQAAPLEGTVDGRPLRLDVPMPDGTVEAFGLVESSILAPEIAAQHPEIRSYTGNGTTHPAAVIRLTLTSDGLHAVVLDYAGDEVYFEHYAASDADLYYNYFTRDAVRPPDFGGGRCETETVPAEELPDTGQLTTGRNNTGGTLRTFRLAMAANGEFSAQHGANQTSAFNKVVQYVATVNLVYRRELSVHFNLVSGTNLIYTNAATDPYTNSLDNMLTENQVNCDAVIGNANYDVAFVWGYSGPNSGGGLASFGVVCDATAKAQGAGGEGGGPYAQVFFDQLVLHEMGHMFGMSHSYNSVIPVCTTRNLPTSVEPGAGATIMSYGFTCDSDDYFSSTTTGPFLNFHTVSYAQADAFLGGVSCQSMPTTGNSPPVVTMPASVTIPKSTPFQLTGLANAPGSGDTYTYSWEGTDIGQASINATTLDDPSKPPFFRSYEPSTTGATRTFPVLSAILNGSNQAKGDKLPSVTTTTNLRLTVRDNNAAGGGLSYGSMTVNVDGSIGPFLETTNLAATYTAGTTQTITWSVNGTNVATPTVNILLSTDGGLTFPLVLAAATPNDGTQQITWPSVQTSTARIKVEAVGNVFFDISNNNFGIDVTNCTAANSAICPTAAVTYTEGDAGLALTMSHAFGTAVSGHAFNLTAASPTGELAHAATSGGTTCQTNWGVEAYETFDFTVGTTGTYTFSEATGSIAFSVFQSSTYNPSAPCSGTFLGSNTYGSFSTNISSTFALSECVTYKLVVWTLNTNYGSKTVSFSGPGAVHSAGATPANTGYTYVAVNNANGQIAAQSAAANFSSLTEGAYTVEGVSYKNGGATTPANSVPSTWVGQTATAIQTSECVVFSSNNKMVTVNAAILPVELLSFTGTTVDAVNRLTWVVGAEVELDFYELQRSDGRAAFAAIGRVSGNADAREGYREYAFEDTNPPTGTNYYRLRTVDLDGSFEYSRTVALTTTMTDALDVYPNPVAQTLHLRGFSNEPHTATVYDVYGRVAVPPHEPVDGMIAVGGLAGGTYLLELRLPDGRTVSKRFVKN